MKINCHYLLFDLDGTLVDSTQHISECWKTWAIEHDLSSEIVDSISRGRTAKETIAIVLPEHPDIDTLASDFIRREINSVIGINAIFLAAELLNSLPSHRWGVVTSATKSLAKARLSCAGLPFPSVLVSSDLVVQGKPAPDGYLLAARLLGAQPEECLVFEDSENGINAAFAAGMPVIQVNESESVSGVFCSIKNYERVRVEQKLNHLVISIDD